MREAGHQRIQQAIELASLRIGGGFAVMGRLHQLAIHIPLHIVDRVLAQQPAHPFQQIIKGFRDIQVQDKLMTPGQRRIARQRQQPVGMGAVEIGVRVNHLWLNPDAELHPQRLHVVDNRGQAVRIFFLIKIPVAERRPVVVAPFKPAVINDKALHAQLRRFIRHAHDVLRVVVEIDPFPGVEMHRARFVVREANNLFAQIAVELLAHAVQPLRRIAGVEVRRPQRFPFRQRHFARQIERFRLQVAATVGFHFRPQAVVTAPAQVHAPHFALHLAKSAAAGNQRRKMFMRSASTTVFQHKAVVFKGQTMGLEFADPAAMKGHDFAGALGDRQRDRQAVHLPRLRAQVG